MLKTRNFMPACLIQAMAKRTHKKMHLPEKPCSHCGRTFAWRKKWASNWDEVKYCSDLCRRSKKPDLDRQLEESVLALLAARAPSSICPSEAAKRVAPDDWRSLMERTRQAARRLAHLGEVVITQGGRPVDPTAFKGPIRVQLHERTADRPSNQQRGV